MDLHDIEFIKPFAKAIVVCLCEKMNVEVCQVYMGGVGLILDFLFILNYKKT